MDWQTLCNDETVRHGIWQAWKDSEPDSVAAHEEGGFVLQTDAGFEIRRWPAGDPHEIRIPAHQDCKIDGKEIVATFHTHPHSGVGYIQEPNRADIRIVRNDANLKGPEYVGEFVLSYERTYLVAPSGSVQDIGRTSALFGP
jgi:hypothetical protein